MAGSTSPFDLESLRLLRSVMETGSISRAAARHGISQPSASTRLGRLEGTLGLTLLRRSPHGSRLTPAGTQIAAEAETLLGVASDLTRTIAILREGASSSLRVAASYTIAEYLINHWLAASQLFESATQLGLEVCNSEAVCELVATGVADLGFVEAPTVSIELDSEVVAHDELVLVAAPTHVWGAAGSIAVEELLTSPLLMREEGSGTREYARQRLEHVLGADLPPPSRELGSTTALKAAAMAGVGATVLSRLTVQHELERDQLRIIELEGVDLRRDLRAVFPRGTRPIGAAKELVRGARRVGVPG